MIKKFGRIVHASSIGVKYGGSEFTFNYSYSKHALEYISSYVKNLAKFNILSNVVRIGVVDTKLLRRVKSKNINKRKKLIPIKRLATKDEISDMIFFLIRKNTYISGENVSISEENDHCEIEQLKILKKLKKFFIISKNLRKYCQNDLFYFCPYGYSKGTVKLFSFNKKFIPIKFCLSLHLKIFLSCLKQVRLNLPAKKY